jgi:hypothetical protein
LNERHVAQGGEPVHGVTKFFDLTHEEFKQKYLMSYRPHRPERFALFASPPVEAPFFANVSIDWRKKDVLTPIKDQGQCGSCWAFATTEAIESFNRLAGNKLIPLSVQQITSCDSSDGGCMGGYTESAYQYVVKAGGIESEEAYPYTSGTGETGTCTFNRKKVAAKISGFKAIAIGEDHLASAILRGPVAICLSADAFQSYTHGILRECPGEIDHCTQLVGLNVEGDYWIVRNSWGKDWGEDGYIRIARGSNLCHIAEDATFPTFPANSSYPVSAVI